MLVENLISTNYFSHTDYVGKKTDKVHGDVKKHTKESAFVHGDAYIPSSAAVQNDLKAKDLSEIKGRIKSGFYNSTAVNEDLTEAFSNIFNSILPQTKQS
jgi:hypothetical protein